MTTRSAFANCFAYRKRGCEKSPVSRRRCPAGVLLFFLSRLLFVSRLPAVFPFIGAALLGIGLLPAGSQSAAHAAGGAALILLLLHIVFAALGFRKIFKI